MKNQNETGGSGRKDQGSNQKTPAVAAGATGMFEQPLGSPEERKSDDRSAELRAASSGGTPISSGETRSSPGEFTRLFQAITPDASAKPAAAAPAPSPSGAPGDSKLTDSKPGEFTRIFMRLPTEPGAEATAMIPADAESSQEMGKSRDSETGEFTRLMRTSELKSESPRTDAAAAAAPPAPSSTPVRGFSTPGKNDAVSGTAGVTELFVAPNSRPTAAPASPTHPSPGSGVSERAGSPFAGSMRRQEQSAGEFTQLFRALDSHQEPSNPRAELLPSPAKLPDAEAGEFTRLMQSLSSEQSRGAEQSREALGGTSAQPNMDVAGSGAAVTPERMPPGMHPDDAASFTRILSSSAAREETARGMNAAADAHPPAASRAKESAPAPPLAAMPGMPRLPQAPQIPGAMAFRQQSAVAAPTPPVLPSPAPVAVPQSKLQAYLPLLLILNAFALAVLIVLVIFALRRH